MLKLPNIRPVNIIMGGGLDLVSPHSSIKPGMVTEALNFDATVTGGYKRILGYERTDGGVTLAEKPWYALSLSSVTGVTVGATLTDAASGATGYVVAIDTANKQVCLTALTGTFGIGHTLIGLPTITIVSAVVQSGVRDATLVNTWQLASNNYYRALINPVPGTGNVLGVWVYKNIYYAFRKNGTYVKMYKANGSGWTEVAFYRILKFKTGVLAEGDIVEGDTIIGGTSGAIATVKRFIKNDGVYGTTASGYMVVQVTSGSFINAEAIKKGGVTKATTDGADYAITFTYGDNKFQFISHNFKATSTYDRMYGCDGVNPAFEFDGTVLTPILMPGLVGAPISNSPKYIEAHKNYLWLAFQYGSLQSSVLGEPLVWSGFLGAAEYGMGSEIKGMKSVMDNALIVATEEGINAFYGNTTDDFTLKNIASNTGCIDGTMAISIRPYVLSKKGIIRVDPTLSFGNFEAGTLSRAIAPHIINAIENKTIVSAGISRLNNHYKIYFSDGTGIIMTQDALTADKSMPNFTLFQYAHAPTCVGSINIGDTTEILLFGDKYGYVYRENTGNNCDGQDMEYALRTAFMHLNSPFSRKSFKHVETDIDANGGSDIRFSYELSYGQLHTDRSLSTDIVAYGSGGYWGVANWSEFSWSSAIVDQQIFSVTGTGHNISILFYGNSNITNSFTINTLGIHYIPRRLNRG